MRVERLVQIVVRPFFQGHGALSGLAHLRQQQFATLDLLEPYRDRLVKGILSISLLANSATKAEAYRTMFLLPDFFDREELLSRAKQTEDREIRALMIRLETHAAALQDLCLRNGSCDSQ